MRKPKRTTDERIDALTDRVDALTQSVELLATMHRDNEKRYAKMFERMDEHSARIEDLMDTLTRVVLNHDGRIRKLERKGKKRQR